MKVLVVNCGSSSLKYQLIDPESGEVFCKGLCERIGAAGSRIEYKVEAKGLKEEQESPMPTHKEALELVIKYITDPEVGVVKSIDEIDAAGHRLVHGGEDFACSVVLNDEVIKAVEANNDLAPLHNPANLIGVRTCMELMPGKPQVGVFDTAFHQTMPPEAFIYPLPYEDYKELKVRKYGFHGTSHKFVSEEMIKILGKKEGSKIIVCHLGNGSSITAVKDGKSIDTSMGLTPLAGLMMGTRCGDIDPAVVLFVKNKRGLSDEEMDARMNKQSGILGLFGPSSDCRDLSAGVEQGDERARLAQDVLCYRIKSYIGAYTVAMGGVDAICFAGGIGENSSEIREQVLDGLSCLGVEYDHEVNKKRQPGNVKLSTDASKVQVYIIPTNEELVIARDTLALTSK